MRVKDRWDLRETLLKADGLSKTSTEARDVQRARERKLSEVAAGLVVTRY